MFHKTLSLFLLILLTDVVFGTSKAKAAEPSDGPAFDTKFENTGKSLSDLLALGFAVEHVSVGLGFYNFVLVKEGRWIYCTLGNTEPPKPDLLRSQCFAIN